MFYLSSEKVATMASTGLLTINLNAIVSNWRLIQRHIRKDNSSVACGAVVKADAYGLGVAPVSSALYEAGCRQFFVATLIEAIELRESLGGSASIFVLSGLSHGLSDEWFKQRLTPVLFDLSHIQLWVDYCRAKQQMLPCVLKVNTGMNRLGIEPEELIDFLNGTFDISNICPIILMSHLACADDVDHELNEIQLNKFRLTAEKIKKIYPEIKLSLSNSSGSFLGADYCFDICRPGAALYGVNPMPHTNNPMQAVVNLSLPVIQQRVVAEGDAVGYGATFLASRETKLAVVFGGYADGLLRFLSNRGYAWCKGIKVPVAGRVSMDSIVFDITGVEGQVETIELLNECQGVDELAQYAETIGYEILTSLGKRYCRQYISLKTETSE